MKMNLLPRRHEDTKNFKIIFLRPFVPLWFNVSFFLIICSLILLDSCGDRFDINDIGKTKPPEKFGDTVYVLQSPVWTGFNQPKDVHVGYEPFVYVADAGNNRIVMFDISGALVGYSQHIKNPVAISQDHRLDLLVCGEFDTTIGGKNVTFGAVYRVKLFDAQHNISKANIYRVYFDPFNASRRYTGIATLADNSYYVARTGPSNSSIVDPDDAIMHFQKDDKLMSRQYWPYLSVDGTGLVTLTQPTGLATFPTSSNDFIFTQQGSKSLFRTQWITYRSSGDASGWESYFSRSRDPDIDFIRVNLFKRPEDVTIDASGNIYVIDAGSDSLFKFNRSGILMKAFGGPAQMKNPEGVAFFDKTLYITDTGNNRILRYVLSTDVR